jgi:hypothetical protein
MTSMPLTGLAASDKVTLTDITGKNPGNTISIAGTSSFSEVIIKVVRPDSTVLYFDVANPSNGAFTKSLTLPANAQLGTYKVVVGQGLEVESDDFAVTATDNSGDGGSSGGSGSGSFGGGGGAPSTTSTTNDSNGNVTLGSDATTQTKETSSDGKEITKVTVNADKLSSAFEQIKNNAKASQTITIEAKGTGTVTNIELPANILVNAAAAAPDAIISIKSDAASYDLPIKALNIDAIVQGLGGDVKNAKVTVKIEKVSGTVAEQIAAKAKDAGINLLGNAIEFSITVESNGKKQDIKSFGDTYVSRSITLLQATNSSEATAVLYDAVTGEISFVPAIFTTVDGVPIVTMKRKTNSIYSVVQSKSL